VGTEDKLLIEMEVQGVAGSFIKPIQMDNTVPTIKLVIDDNGNCTSLQERAILLQVIFFVYDKILLLWRFASTYSGTTSDTVNTPAAGTPFSIPTSATSYPCGSFSLYAIDKTIINSQSVGHEVWTSYNVCLK